MTGKRKHRHCRKGCKGAHHRAVPHACIGCGAVRMVEAWALFQGRREKCHSCAKGGVRNPGARLGEAAVIEIRRALAEGVTGRSLAAEHGVGTSTISRIRAGQSWRGVGEAA